MLQSNYAKESEVPEALKEYYKEQNGVWALDGYVTKEKLSEFRENNRSLIKDKEEFQAQLLKFKNIDPEKYAESMQEIQKLKNDRLAEDDKIEELKAKMEQANDDAIKVEKAKTKAIQETLDKERIDNETARIVFQHALPEEGNMKYIQADIREVASIDPGTGKVIFLDNKGLKRKNDDGEPLTHEEYIKDYIPKSNLFRKSQGGGAMGASDIPMVSQGQVKVDNISGKDISSKMIEDLASGKIQAMD